MNSKALFYILNNADLLDEVLDSLREAGIKGGTIIDSNGMGRELAKRDDFSSMFGTLRMLLKPDLKDTKTLIFILDETKIESVIAAIEKVVGNLDEPGTGLAFAFPIDFIKGLKL